MAELNLHEAGNITYNTYTPSLTLIVGFYVSTAPLPSILEQPELWPHTALCLLHFRFPEDTKLLLSSVTTYPG